jgi:DNA relaxase NicK
MNIEKKKLSKGMSYPLRSSHLQAMLDAANITMSAHLIQGGSSGLFECFFWPPNARNDRERLYIRTAAVSSDRVKEVRLFLESVVIVQFQQWITEILKLPCNSPVRQKEQHFYRDWA